MIITYVRWRDAVSEDATASSKAVAALVELCEVGFLLAETDEVVTIGMEHHCDGEVSPGRWRLHVPKVSIVERRDVEFEKAFPIRRKKR